MKMRDKERTKIVSLPPEGATDEDIEAAAKALGISPEKLTRLLEFVSGMESAAAQAGLTGPELVNACVTLVASTLKAVCPPDQQGDVLSGIFQTLWNHLGLPSDFKPDA